MVESLTVVLRVWDRRGEYIWPDEFVGRLDFSSDDPFVAEGAAGVPRVRLLTVAKSDFTHIDLTTDAGARSQAFAVAVRGGLLRAAAWLDRQPAAMFDELRSAGRVTDVFVGGWIEDDQFDLDLPPEFLRACGRLGLTVTVCTND